MKLDSLSVLENAVSAGVVTVFDIPIDIGKDNTGTDVGPTTLRQIGLQQMLTFIGADVKEGDEIPCPKREDCKMGDKQAKYLSSIVPVLENTALKVKEEVRQGRKVIAIGGDHTLAAGTISGASVACGGDIGVIWIDAHGDMMTHNNTLSGNVHGMPSSAVMGFGHPDLVNILEPGQKVKPSNMIYVGLKDLDQGEIDLVRSQNLEIVTIVDILVNGLSPVVEKILELQKRVKHIWVSLDLDSIDKEFAPGTPMPNTGGLTYREVITICKFIGKNCKLVGFDLVELCPKLDEENKTAKLCLEIIASLLGKEFNWYSQYMIQRK